MGDNCLFCQLVRGVISATIVSEGAQTIAFRDVSPQAPTHVLIIPRAHHATIADLVANAPGVLVEMHEQATAVANAEGIAESGYRLAYNTGPDGGQSVAHVHLHVLGGRAMSWPPG